MRGKAGLFVMEGMLSLPVALPVTGAAVLQRAHAFVGLLLLPQRELLFLLHDAGGNEAEVQRLLEEAAAATQQRGQLETQLDAARAATAAARLEHETTKVSNHIDPSGPPAAARGAPHPSVLSAQPQRGWNYLLLMHCPKVCISAVATA